ncbi:MAG TPA: hypothetical protein VIP98_09085 [Microlunatus sp.]
MGFSRVLKLRPPVSAVAALTAQVMLALGGFTIQALASRELGPSGLGSFALLYGAIIMATALSTGLIGDSLTVLNRNDDRIRRGLFCLGLAVTFGLAAIGMFISSWVVSTSTAVIFGLALASYVGADLLRRMVMTQLRFWSLVLADFIGLIAMVIFLGICLLYFSVSIDHFLIALIISQTTAMAIALARLPQQERRLAKVSGWGNVGAVFRYGVWRGMQQFVRPTMLNVARSLVLVAAGAAAVGQMEAGRIFVAPAMLLVQGMGSYLFSTYAKRREQGPALLGMADRVAITTVIGSVLVAAVAVPALPIIGDLITGGHFELSRIVVLGWACYAASCATVLPYGSLAAVQGRQQRVFLLRVADSLLSLGLVAVLVVGVGIDTSWTPWLLSVGSFAGGVLCRQWLLRPASKVPVTV